MRRWVFCFLALLSAIAVSVGGCNTDTKPPTSKKSANTQDPLVTIAAEPNNYAWWLRAQFRPIEREIRGIPVTGLDPSWQFASELRKDLLVKEVLGEDGSAQMENYGLHFIRSGDFNKDGVEDLALVGVYQDRTGTRGNFLVVLTKADTGGWRKVFLKSWPGKASFLALGLNGNKLPLWSCMGCDMPQELVWDEKAKIYALIPPKLYQ